MPIPLFVALSLTAFTPIPAIQGATHVSPYRGESVTTGGVVTAVASNGFYLQDPAGDGDEATSDGVFVYTGSQVTVFPGDEVEVDGSVAEFLPGDDAKSLTITEIHPLRVRLLARGRALPTPVLVGGSGRIPPREIVDDDAVTTYQPGEDGLDFWESLEGMRVRLAAPSVTSATNSYGETWVVTEQGHSGMSARGALTATSKDANPERVQIDDVLVPAPMPVFRVGDGITDVVGVVDYRFGCFEVLPLTAPALVTHGPEPEVSDLAGGGGRLTIATFNLRNLTPGDGTRMPLLADIIVRNLRAPAIVVLEEVQDASGPLDDGTTHAAATLDSLAATIRRAGGPVYHAREIAPADGMDGGQPGGNIRVALLFDSTRAVFVDRGVPSAFTAVLAVATDSGAALTPSPGRVAPLYPAWDDARKPLAAEFRVGGAPLFVVACHFSSRSGTTPDFGAVQPPDDPRTAKRFAQAQIVRDFVQSILHVDPAARVVVAGDFNDDVFSGALAPLSSSTALYDLHWRLPEEERYSFLYDGHAHAYDRILLSPALVAGSRVDIVHVCAEYAGAASDHDPVLASLLVTRGASAGAGGTTPRIESIRPNPSSGPVMIMLGGSAVEQAAIYDARGRRVRRLLPAEAGGGAIHWDGNDDSGRASASGVYFVRVTGPGGTAVRRVVRIHTRG